MRVAVTYHRVSTLEQDPTLARSNLREACGMRGLEVIEAIEETGSGARNNRPGLQRVMELARQGKVAHVLVWKLDRFGRSALDVLTNVQELERCGVTFLAVTQGLEVGPNSGPMGRLVLTVMAAMAEFERALIRERTALGLAGARARGVKFGRPRVAISRDAVMRAADLRRSGVSWLGCAVQLGAAGYGNFDKATLRRACKKVDPELA